MTSIRLPARLGDYLGGRWGGPAPDCRPSALLAGAGRSGTTWLGDLLNATGAYRVLFEPLHPDHGIPLGKRLTNGQYLRPDFADTALARDLRRMLAGQTRNAWTDQFNTPAGEAASRVLVKEIRVNFALRWIHAQAPEMPIIVIVRHPGAVISSQMRMNWGAFTRIYARLLDQTALFDDHLGALAGPMRDAQREGEFAMRAMLWAAAHTTLFRQFAPGEIAWAFYEDLVRDPVGQTMRLLRAVGLPDDPSTAAAVRSVAGAPSATTRATVASDDPLRQVRKWRDELTDVQRDRLGEILALFGLDALYRVDDDLLPNPAFTARRSCPPP